MAWRAFVDFPSISSPEDSGLQTRKAAEMKVSHEGGLYEFELPEGWVWHPEGDGGAAIAPAAQGLLYVTASAVEDPAQLPSLSRMLAGFLTQQVRPVATDELVPARFPNAEGFAWQYIEEYVDKDRHAVRVWVAGNRRAWAFLNFNAPMVREPAVRSDVDALVASFTLVS